MINNIKEKLSNFGINRIIRILVGIYIIFWGIFETSWIGIIGVLPLLSGILNTCPGNSCNIK
ncbi:MAG TPA: DUF2892 domain-containing protein [Ignavibacteriales bacterium]|nr:DUF2892 domain-containing protein [Ignavibacteriales bacterium]HOL81353.1 DUF2892 domain-containing protein [Ignavibacteriales bacterium]HOM65469.1 DUF2892 domain-containing protein [Ignavibacteriales bacterium]HPD67715.1 DUF2892 domain-containing protein [Ignavibacteriales bacterium]HPP33878.1 DUF2892 domain-containing protein [Ignavibacteriales bacterium]